ncbi:SufB/SufD family protein [Thermospira aquatica]|uniref:SufD family Fe-S cluster assembly protein n=1 Tax=Thermospira aquatica TaxID=2828656 RepID=A0AAX3BFP6_9SPIR|nr:SufD family Fe-S cluster assembly protein [Thermospira aquatica]URA10958.1 SufD family Fe-S cluster assembly protein [Thermospira aquatica]
MALEKDLLQDTQKVGYTGDSDVKLAVVNDHVEEFASVEKGITILPMFMAVKEFPWVKEKMWSLIAKNKDEYTQLAANEESLSGYFIHVAKGVKSSKPIQTCLFINMEKFVQTVHNIVVLEEDAEIYLFTGCATAHYVKTASHIGITEIFLSPGSKLNYTMIHEWADNVEVRPRTAISVAENAQFISNYISLKAVKHLQSMPTAYLRGQKASVSFNSLIYAPEGAYYDTGARIVFEAPQTHGEVISRSVTHGGTVIARGDLVAQAEDVKGHVECDSLLLSDGGLIQAIPVLETKVANVSLTHEAAVGKIAQEELLYLMSRGLSESEAKAMIVKGFLDVDTFRLPSHLRPRVDQVLKLLEQGGL